MKAPEWLTSCEAAIAGETDVKRRAPLLFGRAFGEVERFRYDDALADLNSALTTDPDNSDYLRERAYVHGELSNFAQAIADLDAFIKLHPEDPSGYRERSYARHFSGDMKGAYEDSARVLDLNPESLDALLARGEAAIWIGRLDDAVTDATHAQTRAQVFHEEASQRSASELLTRVGLWRDSNRGASAAKRCEQNKSIVKGKAPKLIGNCSRAFLEATTGIAKADALTTRSIAWLVVADSQKSATEDMKVALAYDPGNIERHINLGFSYLSGNHSWAANREFERALVIGRHWLALAGRASARANLGDPDGAYKDARESLDLHPNVVATNLLADMAFEHGDRDVARGLYLASYQLGSRDDRLIERLRELGVKDPDHAEAK